MSDPFWTNVNDSLDTIETDRPDTAAGVVNILNDYSAPSAGDAFFPGSGGDRQLIDALRPAGWSVVWAEASYYYVARHDVSDETLTYIEGDVYIGARVG